MTDRPRTPPRRFSLADALILIAASAIGLASVRGWGTPRWCAPPLGFFPNQAVSPAREGHYQVARAVSWTIPFGIAATFAVAVARLRRPRPSWRRIARQPGVVGCVVALAAMLCAMSREVLCWLMACLTRPGSAVRLPSPPFLRFDNPGYHPPPGEWFRVVVLEQFPLLTSPIVGIAVACAWGVLKASGRWRPEPGWIDRSGRVLAVYWIALAVAAEVLTELWKFLI